MAEENEIPGILNIPPEILTMIFDHATYDTEDRCNLKIVNKKFKDTVIMMFKIPKFRPKTWACLTSETRNHWNRFYEVMQIQNQNMDAKKEFPFPPETMHKLQLKEFNKYFGGDRDKIYLKNVTLPDVVFTGEEPNSYGVKLIPSARAEAAKFLRNNGAGILSLCLSTTVGQNITDYSEDNVGNQGVMLRNLAINMPLLKVLILAGEIQASFEKDSDCFFVENYIPLPHLMPTNVPQLNQCTKLVIYKMDFYRELTNIRELPFILPNLSHLVIITRHEFFHHSILKINLDQYYLHSTRFNCPIKYLVLEQIHSGDIEVLIRLTNECNLRLISFKVSIEEGLSIRGHQQFLQLLYLQRESLEELDICSIAYTSETPPEFQIPPDPFVMCKVTKLRVNLAYLVNRLCIQQIFTQMFPELIELELTSHPSFDYVFADFAEKFRPAYDINSKVTILKFWVENLLDIPYGDWGKALGRFFPNTMSLQVYFVEPFDDNIDTTYFLVGVMNSVNFQNNLTHLAISGLDHGGIVHPIIDAQLLATVQARTRLLFRKYLAAHPQIVPDTEQPYYLPHDISDYDQRVYNGLDITQKRGIALFSQLETLDIFGFLTIGQPALLLGILQMPSIKKVNVNRGAREHNSEEIALLMENQGIDFTSRNDEVLTEINEQYFKVM